MDDLISRQAAIDKLKREERILYTSAGAKYLIRAFEDLPSAQPEPITVNIDHELTQEEYEKLRKDMANAPIMLLPAAQPEQRWIPCSERMPQTNVSILYCTTTGTVGEGRYDGYNGIHEVWKMYAICGTHWDDEVVAWMPLPEPYKGEES